MIEHKYNEPIANCTKVRSPLGGLTVIHHAHAHHEPCPRGIFWGCEEDQ